MSQFHDGESMQYSQPDDHVPLLTPGKRMSDEVEELDDGDLSTTKFKTVKLDGTD